MAPRVRRHGDSGTRTGAYRGGIRREGRLVGRAEDGGVAEGLPGDAREVHGAAAGAAKPAVISRGRASWLAAGVLLLLLLTQRAAHAHETRPAYLELKETAQGEYSVTWRTPVLA